MTSRTKNALGLLAFAVVAAAMVWFVRRTQRGQVLAIDAMPAGSFLVVAIDMGRLRESPLGEPFLGPGSQLLADKTLTATCGFDPLERIREIAVAVPVEDESGEFGVAISADLTKDELVECARKVIDARGGEGRVTIRQSGSFTLVEPDGPVAKRYPTLAYREGGPFVIARGPWLATILDTTEGKLPSARRESKHLALRRELGQTSDEHPALALVATVLLPKEMRERIKKDMGAEVASVSGSANGPALMAGVLGVESAGLGVEAGDARGADTRATIVLHCEDEVACAAVARLVEKTKKDWSGELTVRLLGASALIENLTVEAHGASLRLTTHAPATDAARWVERAIALRGGHPATPRPRPSSDETIRPGDVDGAPPPRGAGEAGP